MSATRPRSRLAFSVTTTDHTVAGSQLRSLEVTVREVTPARYPDPVRVPGNPPPGKPQLRGYRGQWNTRYVRLSWQANLTTRRGGEPLPEDGGRLEYYAGQLTHTYLDAMSMALLQRVLRMVGGKGIRSQDNDADCKDNPALFISRLLIRGAKCVQYNDRTWPVEYVEVPMPWGKVLGRSFWSETGGAR